jgi:HSP20 family molecular chaperone IbpA
VRRTDPQPLLTLYSEPRRANVWRHGRFLGVTPLPLEVPQGRTVRVQVSLPGFESETLDLSAGERSRLVKLERARAKTQALTRDERPRTKRKPQREPRTAGSGDAYEKF